MKFKEWNKEGAAQESEFKVFRMLEKRFANEPSLLISGFYERNICRLAQDTFTNSEGSDGLSEEVSCFTVCLYLINVCRRDHFGQLYARKTSEAMS